MLYSWPSQGSATAYSVDEASVQVSGRRMADFLETVVAQSGAQHIHLIAHSMGNRALIEAMQTFLAKRARRAAGIFSARWCSPPRMSIAIISWTPWAI